MGLTRRDMFKRLTGQHGLRVLGELFADAGADADADADAAPSPAKLTVEQAARALANRPPSQRLARLRTRVGSGRSQKQAPTIAE